MGDFSMKDNGLFEMIVYIAGSLGLAVFFFAFGLWEAGIIGVAFFLLFSLGTIGEVFQDYTEKK